MLEMETARTRARGGGGGGGGWGWWKPRSRVSSCVPLARDDHDIPQRKSLLTGQRTTRYKWTPYFKHEKAPVKLILDGDTGREAPIQ